MHKFRLSFPLPRRSFSLSLAPFQFHFCVCVCVCVCVCGELFFSCSLYVEQTHFTYMGIYTIDVYSGDLLRIFIRLFVVSFDIKKNLHCTKKFQSKMWLLCIFYHRKFAEIASSNHHVYLFISNLPNHFWECVLYLFIFIWLLLLSILILFSSFLLQIEQTINITSSELCGSLFAVQALNVRWKSANKEGDIHRRKK